LFARPKGELPDVTLSYNGARYRIKMFGPHSRSPLLEFFPSIKRNSVAMRIIAANLLINNALSNAITRAWPREISRLSGRDDSQHEPLPQNRMAGAAIAYRRHGEAVPGGPHVYPEPRLGSGTEQPRRKNYEDRLSFELTCRAWR